MVVSQAQRKASKKYIQKNIKTLSIQLHKVYDIDIINYVDAMENKAAYIKELIRQDIARKNG